MGTLAADIKHAFRMFRQNPGFTATALAALALGIGANTAIFSVINAVILKPLPYPVPDRLVTLMNTSPQGSGPAASVPKFNVWRRQTQVLEDVTAYDTGGPGLNLSGGDRPEQLQGIHVSQDFFRLFGAQTLVGRTFTADEDRPRGGNLVVLSNGIWQRRFGSNPAMVGKAIVLGGESYTIIGVLAPKFAFDPPADIYLPFQADPNSTNQGHYFRVAARLKPGVSLAAAKAGMNLAAEEFRRAFPEAIGPRNSFSVELMQQLMVRNVRTALYILLGAVGCVLLIACANVANLLLARATGRSREIAIRCAIGAGRGRIIGQLLTESVLLSAMGGVAGLVLGAVGVRALLAVNPGNIPRIGEDGSAVTLDWTVLGVTLLLSLLTGVLFGLVPALHASRVDINSTLKEATSRSGSGMRQNKARSVLVIAEMALAIVLLVGAGLLLRTFSALHNVPPGFDPHNVLTMETALTGTAYDQTAAITTMSHQILDRIEAIPGVEAAAATSYLPLEGGLGLGFIIQGRPLTNGPAHGGAAWNYVTPHFFAAFKVPLVRGRVFTERDDAAAPPVVVINEAMAKQYWKNEEPIGQRLIIGSGMGPDFAQAPREIIGIIADARDAGLNNDPQPATFVPLSQVRDSLYEAQQPLHAAQLGGPHPCRSLLALPGHPARLSGSSRPAGGAHPHHGPHRHPIHRARRIQHPGPRHLRLRGHPAGLHRTLRTDGVRRRAADTGIRHPSGFGRQFPATAEYGGTAGYAAGRGRDRHWPRCRLWPHTLHEFAPLRGEAQRPRRLRLGSRAPGPGGLPGQLPACAPRPALRSGDCSPLSVSATSRPPPRSMMVSIYG